MKAIEVQETGLYRKIGIRRDTQNYSTRASKTDFITGRKEKNLD
jgi:hypothetical protein